eukprot:CAMPEP_0185475376 /NCGR_PEP_ID=MMETSP1366-20130426/2519_1 /TAXON_ID=38817 /ORGANISM="Gephyrocapsa oceanica, Strain RCC1303" /LENGTH=96 /DNA_ID=CAMNT_0028082289 /DNA_START=107 /DNA_END=394 /DNA_ORIENTATION=+
MFPSPFPVRAAPPTAAARTADDYGDRRDTRMRGSLRGGQRSARDAAGRVGLNRLVDLPQEEGRAAPTSSRGSSGCSSTARQTPSRPLRPNRAATGA